MERLHNISFSQWTITFGLWYFLCKYHFFLAPQKYCSARLLAWKHTYMCQFGNPRCIKIIWQKKCTVESRKTWLHPSPGKSHISALLPKFSAPSRSPDMEIHCIKINIFFNTTSWLTPRHELASPSSSSSTNVTTAPFWPESDTHLVEKTDSAILHKLHLKLTCISLGQAAPEISRICDLGVCSCPSIPGSHWKIDQIIARTWIISLTVGQDLQGLWVLLPQVIFLIWSCCGREASLRRLPDPGQILCSPTQQLVQVLTAPAVKAWGRK